MGKFEVFMEYTGYVYVGHAQGRFEDEHKQMRPYYQIFVISPTTSWVSENYQASGFKAEKIPCTGADVWNNLTIGERVKLFFDNKKRVQLAVSDSWVPSEDASGEDSNG